MLYKIYTNISICYIINYILCYNCYLFIFIGFRDEGRDKERNIDVRDTAIDNYYFYYYLCLCLSLEFTRLVV